LSAWYESIPNHIINFVQWAPELSPWDPSIFGTLQREFGWN